MIINLQIYNMIFKLYINICNILKIFILIKKPN